MKKLIGAAAGILALALSGNSHAQSIEGYHTDQVFPVVVDSTTFAQSFNFVTNNPSSVTLTVKFYPGSGTAQAAIGPVTCNNVTMPAYASARFTSLRELCPNLVSGSAFGYLRARATASSDGMHDDIPMFAGFSRVSNYAGAGFSVEAHPANTFTSASTSVQGLRRMAATQSSPAYQTNCFIGNLDEITPSTPIARKVNLKLWGDAELDALAPKEFSLMPGQFIRLLDVFSAMGADPAGSHDNVLARFSTTWNQPGDDTNRPGIMTFCTVQDNTSFGADFRIGKLEWGWGSGSHDLATSRNLFSTSSLGRLFEIDAGASANTHVMYFKAPDTVQCKLLTTAGTSPAVAGLEMRLLNSQGVLVGGGNNATSTGEIFLGDKNDLRNGWTSRYTIEVESDEQTAGAVRSYGLYCSSGSGNTLYDIVKYKEAVDRF